ncbi:Carbohydrate sulfotransferase 11 [Chionoecetes opilio]|uniref:Carbohydrate sulfotransferase n=1 Tax=Chionoecetes opilio TaxID=41210 RepID=A0A8J4Y948_CHIOP|nr:Carbohydrate sulfotransferase 11 [Chionoecetes opilio]
MACRLRAVVWGLAGMCVLTCLASVRWFALPAPAPEVERAAFTSTPAGAVGYVPPPGVSQEMRWRRETVQGACAAMYGQSVGVGGGSGGGGLSEAADRLANERKKLINVIVDDKNRVLYCYVPKVACTNWKRVMLILNGASNKTDPQDIPPDSVHRKHVFVKLSDLQPDAIRHRLLTYTKFLFVRHPIERVISAFRNKFEKNYTSSAYFKKRFAVKIMKKYRKGEAAGSIPSNGHGMHFSEFVSYLIDTKKELFNEHWALVSTLCNPCQVRYDFIGKYETLAEDSRYIMEQLGAPPSLHFPEVVASKTTAVVEAYFNALSPKQQSDLIRIYQNDFRAFDYHFRNLI